MSVEIFNYCGNSSLLGAPHYMWICDICGIRKSERVATIRVPNGWLGIFSKTICPDCTKLIKECNVSQN